MYTLSQKKFNGKSENKTTKNRSKQFKVEINFNYQNKQKAKTEYSGNSGRKSCVIYTVMVFRDSKCT